MASIFSLDHSILPSYQLITQQPDLAFTNVTNFPLWENATVDPGIESRPIITAAKAAAMLMIILAAIVGNTLVIVSVFRYERLRIIANSFIVSMAMADLLVASLVMTFNASQELLGSWPYGELVCNLFNANDVLFSTASLLHLCCISVDRYIAVTDPFHYDTRMSRRLVAAMLFGVWGASSLISHVPIHMGWHRRQNQTSAITLIEGVENCYFLVNKEYGIVSSSISFWLPVFVMVIMYVKIFREARRQEKTILALAQEQMLAEKRRNQALASPLPTSKISRNHNGDRCISASPSCIINGQSDESTKLVAAAPDFGGTGIKTPNRIPTPGQNLEAPGTPIHGDNVNSARGLAQHRKKMQRENKAARTLGIIMGAFLFCWVPFFTWYLTTSLCGYTTPDVLVAILFWVGYLNSALNPLIYAFFNRDFREAFRRLLRLRRIKSFVGIKRGDTTSVDDGQGRCCCGLISWNGASEGRSPISGSRQGTSGGQSPVEVHTEVIHVPKTQGKYGSSCFCCRRTRNKNSNAVTRYKTGDMTEMQYLPIVSL